MVLIGDSGVGKSNILSRFTKNDLSASYDSTVGVEFNISTRKVNGKTIKAQIWDTSAKNKYQSMASLNGASAALLVYDITRSQTFENLQMWLSEVREHTDADIILMIVGNKSDLNNRRAVSEKEAQSFAKKEGLLFLETYAL